MNCDELQCCNYESGITMMDVILFEWDSAKAESNRRKHGVEFELAKFVFSDPFALTEQDRVRAGSADGEPSAFSAAFRFCSSPIRSSSGTRMK